MNIPLIQVTECLWNTSMESGSSLPQATHHHLPAAPRPVLCQGFSHHTLMSSSGCAAPLMSQNCCESVCLWSCGHLNSVSPSPPCHQVWKSVSVLPRMRQSCVYVRRNYCGKDVTLIYTVIYIISLSRQWKMSYCWHVYTGQREQCLSCVSLEVSHPVLHSSLSLWVSDLKVDHVLQISLLSSLSLLSLSLN